MKSHRPKTIDAYIEAASPEARPHLRRMYRVLKDVAPEGTEAIKWGVPIFWDHRVLFGFAAYKGHLSFGPGTDAMEHFAEEVADHKTGKGTMQIPYDHPFPEALVRRIATYCLTAGHPGEG